MTNFGSVFHTYLGHACPQNVPAEGVESPAKVPDPTSLPTCSQVFSGSRFSQSDASEMLKDSEQLSSYAEDRRAKVAILWKAIMGHIQRDEGE